MNQLTKYETLPFGKFLSDKKIPYMYCTINCNSYGTHLFESFSDVSASISAISEEEGNVNAVAVRH